MPRQARFVVGGVAAHITQRGHNGDVCFIGQSDYLLYLLHLRELSEKHGCAVHAYCLMTNHVHLLLTPDTEQACSNLMRDLGQRYVQHFNKTYGRKGTLWQGRYWANIAQSARYVIGCYLYREKPGSRSYGERRRGLPLVQRGREYRRARRSSDPAACGIPRA